MQALTSSPSQNGNAPFLDSEPVSFIDELILSGPSLAIRALPEVCSE